MNASMAFCVSSVVPRPLAEAGAAAVRTTMGTRPGASSAGHAAPASIHLFKHGDLAGGQRRAAGRHPQLAVAADHRVEFAARAVAGLDHAHGSLAAIQPETAHLLRRAMAAVAALLKDGLHVAGVVHCRYRRQQPLPR